jgi:hypothetical protein
VEFWFYCTALPASGQQGIFFATPWGGNNFQTYIKDDSTIIWQAYTQNNTGVAVKLNRWYHVAIVKNGSTGYFYINGVLQNTATLTNTMSGTATVGAREGSLFFTGYISDMRVSIGSTVYTGAFTPPTAPLTSSTATPPNLLLNFTNGGIVDQHSSNNLETVGSARVSTAVNKYGNASLSFNTKTDLYSLPSTPAIANLPGDFTVECWVNPTDTTLSTTWGVLDARAAGASASAWLMSLNSYSSGWVMSFFNGTTYNGTLRVQANQWTHIAWVRSGSTLTFYVNGVAGGTATVAGAITGGTTTVVVGTKDNTLAGYGTVGYIDDLRITKGFARYTANFTPPTSALLGQ